MTNPTPHGQVPEALRFTKRPVTIEAIQWTGKNLREVITFTDGPPDTRSHHAGMAWEAYADLVARDGLMIYTLEDGPDRRAKHFADIGDWIIRGVKGEYYPCKPDIFEATYDRAAHVQNPAEIEHVARDAGRASLSANAGEPTCDMRTVVAVAVTMLYDTHPEDVCRVFDRNDLETIVSITEPLGHGRVEDIYRDAWDHVAAPPTAQAEGWSEGDSND